MQEYEVEIGGLLHTVLLTDEDAKAQGLQPKTKERPTVANKAAVAKNKGV